MTSKTSNEVYHSGFNLITMYILEQHKGFELNNLNFKIRDGHLVFIIGKVGSGKSSL